jgi:hypothetical protein
MLVNAPAIVRHRYPGAGVNSENGERRRDLHNENLGKFLAPFDSVRREKGEHGVKRN